MPPDAGQTEEQLALRTSQNAVKAKFAEFIFHASGA